MTATAIKLVVKLWHDDMAENPCDMDGWKVHSFNRRHHNHVRDPEMVGFDFDYDTGVYSPGEGLQAKLDAGLAFLLDYFEHGACAWSLSGEGPQCRWDSVSFAGLVIWEQDEGNLGPKTREDREKDARAFIERYTEWCNGYVYGYTMEAYRSCECCEQDVEMTDEEAGMDLPSCGGFFASEVEYMVEHMKECLDPDTNYEVTFDEQHGYGLADECERIWKGE